jgi:hypothetical protein
MNLLGSLPVGAGEDQNDELASDRHPRPSFLATAMWGVTGIVSVVQRKKKKTPLF